MTCIGFMTGMQGRVGELPNPPSRFWGVLPIVPPCLPVQGGVTPYID